MVEKEGFALAVRGPQDGATRNERMKMKPSVAFNRNRQAVRDLASQYRLTNPRVFGDVVHGTDRDGGDLDIIVDAPPDTTLFDLGGLQNALEQLLGVPIDLVTPGGLPEDMREAVIAEAEPV